MNFLETLAVALGGLTSNKMRTALTMLGIIIGVAVVILVVAIGQGATKSVTDSINALGTNILTITPGASRVRINAATVSGSTASPNRLSLDDAKLIAKNFTKSIQAVAPQVRGQVGIRLGSNDATSNLTGSNLDYLTVTNTTIGKGRFFTAAEIDGSQKVCAIGTTVAEKLTGSATSDLTGTSIAINRQQFRVVGMLAAKGVAGPGGDQDDSIVVPVTTAMRRCSTRLFSTPSPFALPTPRLCCWPRNRCRVFFATVTTYSRRFPTTTISTSEARPTSWRASRASREP